MQYNINEGQDFQKQIDLKARTAISNIMIVVEAAFGEKLDNLQKYTLRKAVLDNINDFKSYSEAVMVFLINENSNKNK
jgi:hypothetical protein